MTKKNCPDCKGDLKRIKLFGRSHENQLSGAAIDADIQFYTASNARRSTLLSMFEPEGKVASYMCESCGRIFLYGTPA